MDDGRSWQKGPRRKSVHVFAGVMLTLTRGVAIACSPKTSAAVPSQLLKQVVPIPLHRLSPSLGRRREAPWMTGGCRHPLRGGVNPH